MTTHTAERTAEINADADALSALKVGDGVTVSLWSDCEAYTIIKRTPTTMTVQQDKATLSPDWKPEFIPGGFVGHCTNQSEQTYTYERDESGYVMKITLRVWTDGEGNERRKWKRKGSRVSEIGGNVFLGRRKFHDYNF